MDSEEDISARLILRNVLQTERDKSPVKGKAKSTQPQSTGVRRSSRMTSARRKSGSGTPLVALQHKLKQRLRESASSPSRRAAKENEESSGKSTLPLLEEDQGATPRGLLRCILQTQAEASMVTDPDVKPMALQTSSTEEVQSLSTESNLYPDNTRDPEVHSELDLSNITMELKQPITRGLSRKRAPASISVSAFERQLERLTEEAAEPDTLEQISSNSSLSLTLHSPSLHMTAKRGKLHRKPTSRELVTEEVFDEAVHIRSQKCPESPGSEAGRMETDSTWQGFTLGLSDVTVPDLAMSNTAVYAQSTSQPATIDNMEQFETNPAERKEFNRMSCRTTTGIKEVGSTYVEEMDAQTQEENDFASQTVNLDGQDPMSKHQVFDDVQEPEKQQLDMPTPPSSDAGTESSSLVVDKLKAKTLCDDVTLAMATESEELNENESGVAQMTKGLLQDEETENLLSPVQGAYSSQHEATTEASPPRENPSILKDGEKDDGEFEGEHGSQSDHVLDPDSALPTGNTSFQRDIEEDEDDVGQESPGSVAGRMETDPTGNTSFQGDIGEDENYVCQELAQQTPAFVRLRKKETTIIQSSSVENTSPRPVAGKARPHQERRKAKDGIENTILPKSHVLAIFRHFAKTKVSSDVYPVVNEILQKYFGRVTEDLEVFASHAKRKTIEKEDVELLMRRQGFLTNCAQVNVLIEKFLPLEYRKLLVPIATSGNKVIPKER